MARSFSIMDLVTRGALITRGSQWTPTRGNMRKPNDVYHNRPATIIDLAAITNCEQQAFDLGQCAETYPEVLSSQIHCGLVQVICAKALVVGYVSYSILATHVFIDALAIMPTYHRRGLGGQLLRFAENEAARLGLATVNLYTDGDVSGNCVFYQRCGYHETERCVEPGILRVFYSKTIAI